MEKQEEKLERITKWDETNGRGIRWNDKHILLHGLVFMIPIIGQMWWFICLMDSLNCRKEYWRKIADNR